MIVAVMFIVGILSYLFMFNFIEIFRKALNSKGNSTAESSDRFQSASASVFFALLVIAICTIPMLSL